MSRIVSVAATQMAKRVLAEAVWAPVISMAPQNSGRDLAMRNASQNVRAQALGPDRVAGGTGMDAIDGHAQRRCRFWMPVHDAHAL
jgi:hypothetical protein